MDAGLYIAAQGMLAEQVRQTQLSNDLSNASTPGYKPDQAQQQSFDSLLLQNTATGQPIGSLQTGVTINKVVTDTSPAPLHSTGQPLDFGIAGTGYFAVQTAQGVRYTRDGQFSTNAAGQLVDSRATRFSPRAALRSRSAPRARSPASALGVFNVNGAAKQGDNYFTGTASAGRGHRPVGRARGLRRRPDPDDDRHDRLAARLPVRPERDPVDRPDDAGRRVQSVGSLGG